MAAMQSLLKLMITIITMSSTKPEVLQIASASEEKRAMAMVMHTENSVNFRLMTFRICKRTDRQITIFHIPSVDKINMGSSLVNKLELIQEVKVI